MAPAPNTHGAGLTIHSETQAYLDLGCEVEFVFFRSWENLPPASECFNQQLVLTVIDVRAEKSPFYARLAYWAGWPRELVWQQLYKARKIILREASARVQGDSAAIHVFHYLRTAHVIPSLPKARTVWSCHEIESEYYARNYAIDQDLAKRRPYGWERRILKRLSSLERRVARSCGLVICVAPAEAMKIAEEWSVPHAAYLPISIVGEDESLAGRTSRNAGQLRMLHIGALGHLPTYTSLEFLLTRVFPLLDADTLSRLSFEVAGASEAGNTRVKAIMEMARPYPMVRFTGFVDDIRDAYRRNDLQVVASTQATGRRTRIIESWAFGLPVLSTTVGSGGVKHLAPGRNILIADDPHDFARTLRELIHTPERLDEIARSARQTYDKNFGRTVVATALREQLNKHFGLNLPPLASAQPVD